MKDFYKILGVRENASEQEIRERWIELTKQYHPDRSEEATSDEKIREINEAYQVLKHSSTRLEYDLKTAYSQRKKESKRGSYFKKLGLPAAIFIVFMVIGIIYFTNSQNEMSETDQKSPNSPITQSPDPAPTHPSIAASTQPAPPHQDAIVAEGPREAIPQESERSNDAMDVKTQERIGVPVQQPNVAAVTPTIRNVPDQRNQADKRNQIGSLTQRPKDVMDPITPSIAMTAIPTSPNDAVANKSTPSINQTDQRIQISQINQTNLNVELAQFKPPSLITTEDEVKKLLNNYVDYYNRQDAKGILSLFSSKAIQNQKDGLEEIGKIYVNFFKDGQEIRYSLRDMKIEIYQNAVEVKARYEIEQIPKAGGEREVWRGPIRWVLSKEDGKLKILSVDYKSDRFPFGEEGGVK